MEGVRLRDARPDDAALLLHFVGQLADYEQLAQEVTATAAVLHESLFGSHPRGHALIVEVAGAPVGFAVWFYSFSTFSGRASLFVEDVFVAEAQRGHGIGRAIFRDLARRALAEGCERMDWSVLDWNAPAIAFYRSIGARAVRGWTAQRLSGEALAALAASQGGRH